MKKNKLKRTDLYITQRQYDEVIKEAADRGVCFSEMFRLIIDKYLDGKMEKK